MTEEEFAGLRTGDKIGFSGTVWEVLGEKESEPADKGFSIRCLTGGPFNDVVPGEVGDCWCPGYWDIIEKAPSPGPGYHVRDIPKGTLGEVSKIEEEFQEFLDATEQGLSVMQLVELSDLLGAVEAWLQKYHPNVTLADLARFKDVTARAFRNGRR